MEGQDGDMMDDPPDAEAPKPARKRAPRKRKAQAEPKSRSALRRGGLWAGRGVAAVAAFYLLLILLFSFVPPPVNIYQAQEAWRLGGIERDWVGWDEIAPVMGRSAVAAEDANFCLHWGFDMQAIRAAIDSGAERGGSTISQQVVKNVFLWHGRSYVRKALEALMTPLVELMWSKQRILEMYLNVAEFGEGVFGVEAAAQHHFGVPASKLSALQAARLAAVLPDPKGRSAAEPSRFVRSRTRAIIAGAETVAADGRAGCFE